MWSCTGLGVCMLYLWADRVSLPEEGYCLWEMYPSLLPGYGPTHVMVVLPRKRHSHTLHNKGTVTHGSRKPTHA